MVEALDQRHAFFTGDVAGANFLCRVVAGAPNAELDAGGVVVEIVDAIIDAVVLAVGSRRALGRGLEAAVLHGVVVAGLRMPLEVIAEVVDFDFFSSISFGLAGRYGARSWVSTPKCFFRSVTETPPRFTFDWSSAVK